jgi:hypothetical protein
MAFDFETLELEPHERLPHLSTKSMIAGMREEDSGAPSEAPAITRPRG